MIIGVSGYGATGASAVLGVIEECKGIQSYNYGTEFQLFQQPDGILDLYHYLVEDRRRLSISTAIARFKRDIRSNRGRGLQKQTGNKLDLLSYNYIDELTQATWKGRSGYEAADQRHFLDTPFFRRINNVFQRTVSRLNPTFIWPPDSKRYYSSFLKEEFISITQNYIKLVFEASGFDTSGIVLLEQLFPPTSPLSGMDFFEDARSIVVERDPRDLFVLTNHLMPHLSRFMPNRGDVNAFIAYYKGLHRSKVQDLRVRYVNYEEFVYNYDDASNELLQWLKLKSEKPRTLFVPEQSINNTLLFRNYPEIENDIRIIEKELDEFLFPFEKYENTMKIKRDIHKAFVSKPGDTKLKI